MKITSTLVTKLACIFIIIVCVLVLLSQVFNVPFLKEILPGFVTMKFNTALCLVLSAATLLLLNQKNIHKKPKLVTLIFSLFVLLIASLTLSEYVFNWNAGIDNIFHTDQNLTSGSINPGRMPVATASLLFVFSLVLLFLHNRRAHFVIHVLLITGMVFLVFIFLGSLSRISFGKATAVINTAVLQSRFMFLALFIAAFFSHPLSYLKFSFQKKIIAVFVMVCLFLAVIFFAFKRTNERAVDTANSVEHTSEVLFKTEQIRSDMAEMQSSIRGFLVAGEEVYLPLFVSSATVIENNIRLLKTLTRDNAGQQKRIDSLQKNIASYIESRKIIISIIRSRKQNDGQIVLSLEEGKKKIDKARNIIAAIRNEENSLLIKRKSENKQSIQNTSRAITIFQVVTVFLLIAAFIVIISNIRQRNKAEKQLKEYKYFFDNSNDLCLIANEQGYFETITPRVEQVLGYSNNEITKTPFIEFVHPDDIPSTLLVYDQLKAGATVINFVNRYRKKDGSYLWFDWNASPNPATGKLYCIARDITERKKLEDKLKQFNLDLEQKVKDRTRELSNSEQRFRALIENSSDAISLLDASSKVIYQSPAAKTITGFSAKDRNGGSGFVNIHHDDVDKAKNLYSELLQQPGIAMPMLFRAIHQKAHYIWVEGTATNLLHDEAVKAIVINFRDVTHRIEAEENIKNSEEKRRLIMGAAIDAIICMDTKGAITFWNPQAEKTFGWKEQEVIGSLLADTIIPPAFRDMHTKGLENYLKTGHGPALNVLLELRAINRMGKEFPIELTVLPINQGGEAFFCAFIRDISQRKHSELLLKQLNESLEKRAGELLASNTELERFAYIASHDLQEPLRMVSSFLSLLEEGIKGNLDETNREYLHFAVDGAERMKTLIQALLQYSRVGTNKEEFAVTNLNEVILYVTLVLEEEIKKNKAEIIIKPLPVIMAHKTLLNQLFMNLFSNALKYRSDKNPIIEVGCADEDSDKYTFYVKDNGLGVDPKYFDKIFIIFQRLHNKSEYSGTGIGLAICKKIVEAHNGRIWVESVPGKGSTFYFSILKK